MHLAIPTLALAADGKVIFGDHCASCHGLDGRARTPAGRKVGAKDLATSKATDEEMTRLIQNGMRDANGAARMPSFSDRLDAAAVSAVVAYVKTFRR